MFLFSSLGISVYFPPPPAMIVKASQSTRSNQCFLTPSPLGSCCQNKKSESPIITAACDSVALANGCSDHLLDGCGRKTTAARGRAVDGEAPPGHAEPPVILLAVCIAACEGLRVHMNTSVDGKVSSGASIANGSLLSKKGTQNEQRFS